MRAEDRIRIEHMLDATRSVARFIAGRRRGDLDDDEMLRFALVHAIQIIGEAASKVSPEGRQLMPGVPWREAIGIRHRLVHAYFDVDLDVLWKTATEAVPALMKQLESIDFRGE
jgi:uncharacterized protein with HEPN domain